MRAEIRAIEYYLPSSIIDNESLASEFPEWTAQRIESKLGIRERHIAAVGECASDLGFAAAEKLFRTGACTPDDVDYLLFCTQSPDYLLPTTACLMQARLGIPTTSAALDFNLGCSGYVYGLSLAKGLIETGQANNVLLITAETYSKYIEPGDKSVKTLFGDAASATLMGAGDHIGESIGPFAFGTDGSGGENLIVRSGGARQPTGDDVDEDRFLHMNGPEIFDFTLRVVPDIVARLLEKAGKSADEIELFVFHQANVYMLEHLRRKLKIPSEKFSVAMADCGNTVSSSIPIALRDALEGGQISRGKLLMLVGFGVGYSWGATLVRWI
ncbi:MAG TPA: ketoacyl-ACP synthase III [Armatimonadota bacterium]|nr:ketoacyl-ACP synthase III [Armatimonadota bacterium]